MFDNERELFRLTKRVLNKNRFYRSGIVTFQVYITKKETNTIISAFAFPEIEPPFSKQGLIIHVSEFEKYSVYSLNQYAFFNSPLWKIEEAVNLGTNYNNSIFMNEKGVVCDCISANIFMIKGKMLYTPSMKTGCYADSLRSHILEIAPKLNLKVLETDGIRKDDIFQMNEIFLASEENGIQWVLGVDNKRFVHNYSVKIHELINEHLKNKVR